MSIELTDAPRFVPSETDQSHLALLSALAEAPDLPAAATFLLTDILATTGARRSPLLADVPTVQEAGYPALEANEWFGVFVPANTPTETVTRLNGAIRALDRRKG